MVSVTLQRERTRDNRSTDAGERASLGVLSGWLPVHRLFYTLSRSWRPAGYERRKLPRQFLQRVATTSEQGDSRAPLGQSDRRGQPDPRRSARDNENTILDLHRLIFPSLKCRTR